MKLLDEWIANQPLPICAISNIYPLISMIVITPIIHNADNNIGILALPFLSKDLGILRSTMSM